MPLTLMPLTLMPLVVALLALALMLVPDAVARARLGALLHPVPPERPERLATAAPLLISALIGLSAALGIGGLGGVLVGLVLAAGGHRLMGRLGRRQGPPVDRLGAAGTFDLLAACLASGLPVATAALVVVPSAPPRVAAVLRQAGELLTLGAEPGAAWAAAAAEPSTEALARIARRSARSGASLSTGIAELAAHERGAAEDSAAAAAERAGVLVAGPLGLCFLPAFVCLGVVPVVLGLAGPLLHGGII